VSCERNEMAVRIAGARCCLAGGHGACCFTVVDGIEWKQIQSGQNEA
jgi:hypothetical protein